LGFVQQTAILQATYYILSNVSDNMMSSKRLQKVFSLAIKLRQPFHTTQELLKIQGQLAPGITLVQAENLKTWLMDIQIMDANPIYQGEIYRLKFEFSSNYPIGINFLS
jgi:hypothetical protein